MAEHASGARRVYGSGRSCFTSVLTAFEDELDEDAYRRVRAIRDWGGCDVCGAARAVAAIAQELGVGALQEVYDLFAEENGGLRCAEIRGGKPCMDYVVCAASIVDVMMASCGRDA